MIFDRLEHLTAYDAMIPALSEIHAILNTQNLKQLSAGRHEIRDGLYFNIDDYTTSLTLKPFEVHHLYADVQMMLKGEEQHQIADRNAAPQNSFDESRDIAFFQASPIATFHATPEHFLLYLPYEPHRSQIAVHQEQKVRKVVFKIRMGDQ